MAVNVKLNITGVFLLN